MNITLVATVKDEKPWYIEEWLRWHSPLFDSIILYNNGGEIDSRAYPDCVRQKLIIIGWPGICRQMPAYNHALHITSLQDSWMMALDLDEFLVNCYPWNMEIKDEKLGAISFNWLTYGTCGVIRENMTPQRMKFKCADPRLSINKHVKSMALIKAVVKWENPHFPILRKGFVQEHVNGTRFNGPFFWPADYTYGQIDHYFTRSEEEWKQKVARGRADVFGHRKYEEINLTIPDK